MVWLVVPGGPEVIVVSGGVVSTVNERLAGDGSGFAAASIARTAKVCGPSVNALVVKGDVHDLNAAPSTLHSNVEPVSLEEKPNCGVGLVVSPLGPESMDVSGGPVSTVKDALAGVASVFPAASLARTWNVCGPSPNAGGVSGDVHGANAAESMLHSKLAVPSGDENWNVGVESAIFPLGAESSDVSGGVVSTVNV
jgi:hypothetical protein